MSVPVSLGPHSYEVMVGNGILADVPELILATCPAAAYAVISDETVADRYGRSISEALNKKVTSHLFTFPEGEAYKTRQFWASITDRMVEAGIGRDGAVVAVGGGVSGDLGGFIAATYNRGIPYVQVPTSLLAMVDSSVGGKTGVDTKAGKNLVGAFHQPKAVFADVKTLASLPEEHLRAGLAEALKHGVIADANYFSTIDRDALLLLSRNEEALTRLVARSVEIKSAVVAEDERDMGKRSVLNFGHTVGHAIEAASDFHLLHGQAVAIGMVIEAEIGKTLGVTALDVPDRLRQTLTKLGLPTRMPEKADVNLLFRIMERDKKNRFSEIHLALPAIIGEFAQLSDGAWTQAIARKTLESALS